MALRNSASEHPRKTGIAGRNPPFSGMFRRVAAVWSLSLVLTCGIGAEPPAELSAKARKAYAVLAETPEFCGLLVGTDGATPTVLYAFRTLLAAPQADAAFKELLLEATQEGKIYALCGLYHTDPIHFEKVVQMYRTSDEPVNALFGCVSYTMTVGEIVEKKDGPAAVRRRDRKQSFETWRKEMQSKNLGLDVIGGGWPSILAEAKVPTPPKR